MSHRKDYLFIFKCFFLTLVILSVFPVLDSLALLPKYCSASLNLCPPLPLVRVALRLFLLKEEDESTPAVPSTLIHLILGPLSRFLSRPRSIPDRPTSHESSASYSQSRLTPLKNMDEQSINSSKYFSCCCFCFSSH